MKNILALLALLIFGLTSCSDREEVEPAIQTVTYQVECDWCVVYFEDNRYQGEDKQGVAVDGIWNFTFEKRAIDTARMEIYVSVFSLPQHVRASITTSDRLRTSFNDHVYPGERLVLLLDLQP